MKNILAENMLRFGVKNLNESQTQKVKTLAEQKTNKPLDVNLYKQFIQVYGNAAFDFVNAMYINQNDKFAEGTTYYINTPLGILHCLKSTGTTTLVTDSVSFVGLTKVYPVSVTVPAKKALNSGNAKSIGNDVVLNFIGLQHIRPNKPSFINPKGILSITPVFNDEYPPQTKFTWEEALQRGGVTSENANTVYYVGQAVSRRAEYYYMPMTAFTNEIFTSNIPSDVLKIIGTKIWNSYFDIVKTKLPKPGAVETQWAVNTKNQGLASLYKDLATSAEPAAAAPVNTPAPSTQPTKR